MQRLRRYDEWIWDPILTVNGIFQKFENSCLFKPISKLEKNNNKSDFFKKHNGFFPYKRRRVKISPVPATRLNEYIFFFENAIEIWVFTWFFVKRSIEFKLFYFFHEKNVFKVFLAVLIVKSISVFIELSLLDVIKK